MSMRALCGAIIAAGALIGLGLTSLGIGTRYAAERAVAVVKPADSSTESSKEEKQPFLVRLSQMDRPLLFILVFQSCTALVGLGIAFVGLAYHHHRRNREFLWEKERAAAGQRTIV
jgi:hypothetical protein